MSNDVTRNEGLDVAKGIAIIFVAIFHATRGFEKAGILEASFALSVADTFAYGFHVQIFFLIAGYFTFPHARSMSFQFNRFVSLYYPYLLWSTVSWAMTYFMAGSVNRAYDLRDLAYIPIVPIQHFWFLTALIVSTVLLAFARTQMELSCLAILSAVCFELGLGNEYGIILYFIPFMAMGAIMRIHGFLPSASVIAGMTGFAMLAAAAVIASVYSLRIRSTAFIPASLGGSYALYTFSSLIAPSRVGRTLMRVGKMSLVIYLLHVIIAAGFRAVLYKIVPTLNVWIGIALCLIPSIIFPMVIGKTATRLGCSQFLGFTGRGQKS